MQYLCNLLVKIDVSDNWILMVLHWWQFSLYGRTLMLRDPGFWWRKRPKPSPTSQSCRQHISSPTSVTNIDVSQSLLPDSHVRYIHNVIFLTWFWREIVFFQVWPCFHWLWSSKYHFIRSESYQNPLKTVTSPLKEHLGLFQSWKDVSDP